jgi:serine phosphatase RsbU (regulator of sigma subunit)
VVADRVAGAIVTRQLALEQAAAAALERSLLPTRLPDTPGLEMAARYVPAQSRNVGGDWYDVFTLPSGSLWVVMGDVAGHGLPAAVVMGRVRSALRAYALLDEPPERVLELVDRKVRHFEIGTIATVLVAVTEPPYEQLRLATAGHPPPAIAVPGASTVIPRLEVGPPLGTGFDGGRAETKVDFPEGTVAVFYTDGLIERRGESIDVGLGRLRDAVVPGDARWVATEVMRSLVGRSTPEDDIAVVVVRRT